MKPIIKSAVPKTDPIDFLKAHLNVAWLRPESALWDAIASTLISKYDIISPSLDLGCGNGIFSFITAGGSFSIDYDWYINVEPEGFWEDKDIYNVCKISSLKEYILELPKYSFTFGLDHKPNLLAQAKALNLYKNLIEHDANKSLPFEDGQLETVFSNILYWLSEPKSSLKEIYRILDKNGLALLCIPNKKFLEYCFTYRWEEKNSSLLKKLNRGRSENMHWVVDYKEFAGCAKDAGFKVVHHQYYLSRLTLTIWDIGLRPLSAVLIKMANALNPEQRRTIKREWMETVLDFLLTLYEMEINSKEEKGFHFFVLEKGGT